MSKKEVDRLYEQELVDFVKTLNTSLPVDKVVEFYMEVERDAQVAHAKLLLVKTIYREVLDHEFIKEMVEAGQPPAHEEIFR